MAKTHQERLEMVETLWNTALASLDFDNGLPDPTDVWAKLKDLLQLTGWELDAVRLDDETTRTEDLSIAAIRLADADVERELAGEPTPINRGERTSIPGQDG
jgi:hypothetical protein